MSVFLRNAIALSVVVISSSFLDLGEKAALSAYQKEVLTYFKEIALGFEYGQASGITRKWDTTMRLYYEGPDTLRGELESIVGEINDLASDGFSIELVPTRAQSNMHVFVGHSSEYSAYYPADAGLARANSGVYRIYWNRANAIVKGHLYVSSATSHQEQRHVLREELTQSLGLGRDSFRVEESVFQSRYTTPTEYAAIDRDLIRLLYHPLMPIGAGGPELEGLLARIILGQTI